MTTYRHISVQPVAGTLGAEIHNVNLSNLNDAEFTEIRAALLDHQVIFFRDQELTRDQHKAFGHRFGALHVHPFLQPLKEEGHPEFLILESDAQHPFVAEAWHSDVTFQETPPLGSVLRCVAAPEFGGDTMWASMYAAYDALSSTMQRLLGDLVAVHDTSRTFSRESSRIDHIGGKRAEQVVSAEHPVIRTHPDTGRKSLFVNSAFTHSLKGMKPAESTALLDFLYRHIEGPDFTCRFRWRKNSMAMWDTGSSLACPQYHHLHRDQAHSRLTSAITAPQTPRWRPPAAGDYASQPLTGTRRATLLGTCARARATRRHAPSIVVRSIGCWPTIFLPIDAWSGSPSWAISRSDEWRVSPHSIESSGYWVIYSLKTARNSKSVDARKNSFSRMGES